MGWLRESLEGYKRSLKAIELEEPLDVYLYRPLGFVVARLAMPTRLSPDHVSLLSLACGVGAGVLFWMGTTRAALLAAACYFFCNVLDCADGQLARLRGSSSPVGYIIDGCTDYAATIAIFLGITHAVALHHDMRPSVWILGLAALASMGWQCALLDRQRHEWQSRVYGARRDPAEELAYFRGEAERWRREGSHLGGRALVALYVFYRTGWTRFTPPAGDCHLADSDTGWAARNRPVLRAASLMGPSLHMTAILVAAVAGRLDLYLWATVTIGNVWALIVLSMHRHASLVARAV